jgi:hypothetical protein
MGAVIMQEGQPIEYASCTLTDTQKAYAQIEKEFLAVQYGLTRFHQYIYGQSVTVETDHLPLLAIVKKNLGELTPRLLRMRLRMQVYDFELVHKPGTELYIADTLSRAYLSDLCESHDEFVANDHDQVHAVVTGILAKPTFREKFRQATCDDHSMNVLKSYIVGGWPKSKRACIEPLRAYWNAKNELSTHEDLVLRNSQIVVPVSMRREILNDIHRGHLGISKCHERAKNAVYWPGYHGQISDMVEGCSACQENMRANDKKILEPYEIPQYPMQSLSMDVFQLDSKDYLVTIDRYSKWPSCFELKHSTSREIIEILERQFLDFGRPESCVSDNASYFSSFEFRSYLESIDVKQITVSPYTSRSNGLAERTIQTIKSCLVKAKQSGQTLRDVLVTLRTTPLGNGLPAPCVLLQSRQFRDHLNFSTTQLKMQKFDHAKIEEAFRKQLGSNANKATQPNEFRFITGSLVWVKTGHRQWERGVIMKHAQTPRSFWVEMNGKTYRRNQSDLRERKPDGQQQSKLTLSDRRFYSKTGSTEHSNNIAPNNAVGTSWVAPSQTASAPPASVHVRRSERVTRPVQKLNYSRLGGD